MFFHLFVIFTSSLSRAILLNTITRAQTGKLKYSQKFVFRTILEFRMKTCLANRSGDGRRFLARLRHTAYFTLVHESILIFAIVLIITWRTSASRRDLRSCLRWSHLSLISPCRNTCTYCVMCIGKQSYVYANIALHALFA